MFTFVLFWRHAYVTFEYLSEEAYVLIAAAHGYCFDVVVGGLEHFFCVLYSVSLEIFQGGIAGRAFEPAAEVPGAHVAQGPYFFERDVLIVIILEVLLDPGDCVVAVRPQRLLAEVDHEDLRGGDGDFAAAEFFDEVDHEAGEAEGSAAGVETTVVDDDLVVFEEDAGV